MIPTIMNKEGSILFYWHFLHFNPLRFDSIKIRMALLVILSFFFSLLLFSITMVFSLKAEIWALRLRFWLHPHSWPEFAHLVVLFGPIKSPTLGYDEKYHPCCSWKGSHSMLRPTLIVYLFTIIILKLGGNCN